MEEKRYFIYAYDEMYNGLHGMYDYCFDECTLQDAEAYGYEMSYNVIESYSDIYESLYDENASDDDLKMLVAKRFIIPFASGIVVIKHWKIHNYIRGDRKKATVYPEEMSLLVEKENGAYSLNLKSSNNCSYSPKSSKSSTIPLKEIKSCSKYLL